MYRLCPILSSENPNHANTRGLFVIVALSPVRFQRPACPLQPLLAPGERSRTNKQTHHHENEMNADRPKHVMARVMGSVSALRKNKPTRTRARDGGTVLFLDQGITGRRVSSTMVRNYNTQPLYTYATGLSIGLSLSWFAFLSRCFGEAEEVNSSFNEQPDKIV